MLRYDFYDLVNKIVTLKYIHKWALKKVIPITEVDIYPPLGHHKKPVSGYNVAFVVMVVRMRLPCDLEFSVHLPV